MSNQTCKCIKFIYKSVGDEPIIAEIESNDTINGKPVFYFGENNVVRLSWGLDSGGVWLLENTDNNTDIAVLLSNNNCPFGNYTILETNQTEMFVVQPCETEEDRIINCYKLTVWSKQCEYSKCVLEYVNNLIFGVEVCKLQESLKEQRRALEILNCYDPRDIANNTTNYNTITYSTIKKLLNK